MYKTYRLSNGVTVVTEKIPHFRSVSFGLWIKAGSVHESVEFGGISHFIEHMLFKGTSNRSARDIADLMDGIGGQLNAFTSKEYTCLYFHVLDEHLQTGIDLLTDMLFDSSFDASEIEKEKGVIGEEILMYEDSPEDVAYDLLSEAMFKDHPLSNPILGTKNTLTNFNRTNILSFFQSHYANSSVIISVAGNFDDGKLEDLISKNFANLEPHKSNGKIIPAISYRGDILFRNKDTEQTHICIGFPGISLADDRLFSMAAFNNIFAGSMSSRLFQKIREDRGLVYSIISHPSNHVVGGYYTVYASMNPSNAEIVVSLIIDEVKDLLQRGISSEELAKSKEQLKGNYILGLESTGSRMNSIGKSQLLLNKCMTPEQVLSKINDINMKDIISSIKLVFSQGIAGIAIIGKVDLTSRISKLINFDA